MPPEMSRLPIDLYDSSVAYVDAEIGRLLARLDELGRADGTVVVFTSDHGELLGEHNIVGHGAHLWNELTEVPLKIGRAHV